MCPSLNERNNVVLGQALHVTITINTSVAIHLLHHFPLLLREVIDKNFTKSRTSPPVIRRMGLSDLDGGVIVLPVFAPRLFWISLGMPGHRCLVTCLAFSTVSILHVLTGIKVLNRFRSLADTAMFFC